MVHCFSSYFSDFSNAARCAIMEVLMTELKLKGEYITLGQLLKAEGLVEDGVEAKERIQAGEAMVNGEVDTRRGRKLRDGDIVTFDHAEIKVVR